MMLVCDLDGTLTFDGRRPQPEVLRLLEDYAARSDVRLVLATARSPRCLRAWFGDLTRRIDLVCCNGALHVPPGGRPATRRPLPAAAAARLLRRLDRVGAGWVAEYGDHFVAPSPDVLPWFGSQHRRVLAPGEAPRVTGILKVSVEDARAGLAAATGLPRIVGIPHATGDMDVVAEGVDKAVAVAHLNGGSGADLAVGNDRNDLTMLARAHRALVVGGGLGELDDFSHVTRVRATPQAVADALSRAVPDSLSLVGGPVARSLSQPAT